MAKSLKVILQSTTRGEGFGGVLPRCFMLVPRLFSLGVGPRDIG